MADTLKRVGPTALTTGSVTIYTVPAATQMIVRNIHVVSYSAAAVGFSLSINAAASVAASAFFSSFVVPSYGAVDWSGTLSLTATDYLSVLASAASSLSITVSGVEIT